MSTATFNLPSPQNSFKRSLLISLVLHINIVLLFTIKVILFPTEDLDYQSAVKVDLIALPDKITSPPAEETSVPKEPPSSVVEEKPKPPIAKPEEPVVSLEKTKIDKKKAALDKLKKLSALDKIKELKETEKRSAIQTKKVEYKGNVLSAGTELTGINSLQHDNYKASIDRHVKNFWTLPQWLAQKELSAQVRVFLDQSGNVTAVKLLKSSGNPTYDENVLETVKNASPFPSPPEKFVAILSERGIVLGFPE